MKPPLEATLSVPNMNMSKIKLYAASIFLLAIMFYLFYRYVPWLFDSKPISEIGSYDLSNLPAPEGALSFAINNGQAIFFFDPIPGQMPFHTAGVVIAFLACSAGLGYIVRKLGSLKNDT